MPFEFDEKTHTYTLDGRPLISVTQILKAVGLIDYSMVPPDVLQRAMERGKAVHKACHYFDEDDLDLASVDPRIVGYVKAWERFRLDSGLVIESVEKRIYHPAYLYAGTPDVVGTERGGRRAVYDRKTFEPEAATGYQLAGYEAMLRGVDGAPLDRYGVWLKPDGTYKLVPYTKSSDWQVFAASLTVANEKRSNGGAQWKAA